MESEIERVAKTIEKLREALSDVPTEHQLEAAELTVNLGIALMKCLVPIDQVHGYLSAATEGCRGPQQIAMRFPSRH